VKGGSLTRFGANRRRVGDRAAGGDPARAVMQSDYISPEEIEHHRQAARERRAVRIAWCAALVIGVLAGFRRQRLPALDQLASCLGLFQQVLHRIRTNPSETKLSFGYFWKCDCEQK
jgi:hypothetical protein